MANFRFRRSDGGSTLRGGDGLRAADQRTFSFAASGGIRYAGAATVEFAPVVQPRSEAPQGHGIGPQHRLASLAVPIAIRQYGEPVTFRYRASGGIWYAGEADVRFTRNAKLYRFAAEGGFAHGGRADVWRGNDDDDYLALAA